MKEIREIPAALPSSDSPDRLPGIIAVRKCDSAVTLPMLLRKVKDGEFMVRFVAMGWRQTQTAEALAALLKMMQFDRDPNVRAEAANYLSMFGAAFRGDDNLLVRRS